MHGRSASRGRRARLADPPGVSTSRRFVLARCRGDHRVGAPAPRKTPLGYFCVATGYGATSRCAATRPLGACVGRHALRWRDTPTQVGVAPTRSAEFFYSRACMHNCMY